MKRRNQEAQNTRRRSETVNTRHRNGQQKCPFLRIIERRFAERRVEGEDQTEGGRIELNNRKKEREK